MARSGQTDKQEARRVDILIPGQAATPEAVLHALSACGPALRAAAQAGDGAAYQEHLRAQEPLLQALDRWLGLGSAAGAPDAPRIFPPAEQLLAPRRQALVQDLVRLYNESVAAQTRLQQAKEQLGRELQHLLDGAALLRAYSPGSAPAGYFDDRR